jgi:predicted dehydrogenase
MPYSPVRWGILGASKFAREHMGPAIHEARGAELVALATSSVEKAAPFKAFQPRLKVHDSYQELLDDPGIDAVYIPLPNAMHVEWTRRAMEAGKHVLCEKPIAMHASEIDALIAMRDRTGLLAAEAYMIVHHPQWQRVRDLVQAGEIGTLRHVDGAFTYNNAEDTTNIRNKPDLGGGALPDIGVYVFGSTRFVTGAEPTEVTARIERENGVDVLSRITAEFPGFSYSAYVSMRLEGRQEMVFHGDKGLIRLTAPFNAQVFGGAQVEIHHGMTVTTERFPAARQYALQVEAFCRSVRTGEAYPCPLEFAQGTQRMIDMAFASES